jgi:hypothetical protein
MPPEVAAAKAREKFPELFKEQKSKEEPSRKAALAHGAERGVLPGLAGIAGGRAAGALASWALGPEVGIPVTLASLVGGLGTATAAGYGQEKALEHAPEFAKSVGQDVETQRAEQAAHPYYAAAGEGLGSLLGMRPNLRALMNAETRNVALGKMGVGAGIGAGIDTGFQLYNGQPYDPVQALIAAGVGGLGTEENRIGRRAAALGEAPVNLLQGKKAFPARVIKKPGAETETETETETEPLKQFPEVSKEEAPKRKGAKETPSPVDIGALFRGTEEGAEPSSPVGKKEQGLPPRVSMPTEEEGPPPGYEEELPPPASETAAPAEVPAETPATKRVGKKTVVTGLKPTGGTVAPEGEPIEEAALPPASETEAPAPPEAAAPPQDNPSTPTFNKLPTYSPGQKTMTYAGIGSRSAPPKVLGQMNALARKLSGMGYTLRSGGAKGSDSAFEAGAGDRKEIYSGADATNLTRSIAKEIHPAPDKLSPNVLDLMARNTNQIFGENLNAPVDFVLTYTPDGAESSAERSIKTGGTGQAIDMASRKGVPVINMAKEGWENRLVDVLSGKAKAPEAAPVEPQRAPVQPKRTLTTRGTPKETGVPTEKGWAARDQAISEKQAEAAQRAARAAEVRLDSPEHPAATEADHAAAIEALKNGKFVVRESFKKDRNRPADSVFHVVDTLEEANLLTEQLNDKTYEKPTDVKIIPPSDYVEARKAADADLEAYRDYLDRKPGEDTRLLKRVSRDATVVKKVKELLNNPKFQELLGTDSYPPRSTKGNAQDLIERFLGDIRRNDSLQRRIAKENDPVILDAIGRIEERRAQIAKEQKDRPWWKGEGPVTASDTRKAFGPEDPSTPEYTYIRPVVSGKGPESAATYRPEQLVYRRGIEPRKGAFEGNVPLEELPEGVAKNIEARKAAEAKDRAEKAAVAEASKGEGWKPNKPLSPPSPPEVSKRDERFNEAPEGGDSVENPKEPTHTLESLHAALKEVFGVHTQRLLKSGFLKVLPTDPDGSNARGMYFSQNNEVHLYADQIPIKDFNLKGLVLHEIGAHAGLETMLGPDLFKKLLAEVRSRAKAGEKPFVTVDKMVPSNTDPWKVDEERLAYIGSAYKDLPFAKRMYAQIRQYIWRKMGGRFITLNNEDIQAMLLSSYERMGRLAVSGKLGEAARKLPFELRDEYMRRVDEANQKLANENYAEQPDFTPADEQVQARTAAEMTQGERESMAKDEKQKLERGTLYSRFKSFLHDFKDRPYHELLTRFQDYRRLLRNADVADRAVGRIGKDDLGLFDLATLRPSDALKAEVKPLEKAANDAFRRWRARTGESIEDALAFLKMSMIGLTEPDVRKYLFARFVPMNDDPRMFPGQSKPIGAATLRDELVKAHETMKDLTSADAKQKYGYDAKSLREYVDYLAKNFAERGGVVPENAPERYHQFRLDPGIEDISHNVYDVADTPPEKAKRWRDQYYAALNGPHGAELAEVMRTEKALRDKVTDLNFRNGQLGQHFSNAVAFQGRQHYYSLKGDMERYGFDFMNGSRLGSQNSHIQAELGGRGTISDNPYTQTFADANVALSRYDSKEFLDELYKRAKAGTLKDRDGKRVLKVLPPVELGKRRAYELPEGVTPAEIVLRANEEGGYDVMQIKNKEWREAIKGLISTQSMPMTLLGKGTRFITAGVTRFNPGFAPINAIRHLATNIGNIGAEYGAVTAMKVATRFATQLVQGSPFKAARAAHLIATNNTAELTRLAQNDSFYANINDWYTKGGRISWNSAYTNETASRKLVDEVQHSGMFAKSKESLEYVADIWNNIFEFMNREAAFDVLKKKFAEEGSTGEVLNKRAASITKNLLNLEAAGRYSKDMASWFGLFKAEATGAARQIDALMTPLFTTPEKWIADNYGTLNGPDKQKALEFWKERRTNAILMSMAAMGFGYAAHKMARAVAETDDEGRNLVGEDDKAQWVRNLRVPTTILGPLKDKLGPNDKFINIPWGFGTGAFASIGAQISMLEDGDVKPVQAAQHMISAAKESFMPIPLEDWGLFNHNPMGWAIASAAPTVVKPMLYYAWNADAFGRQIYNTRTGKYGEAYSGGDYVPEMFKSLSKALFDATDGAIDWSPHSLQFYANNYVQGVANIAGAVTGNYQNLMGEKEFDIKTDLPVFSSLVGKQTDSDAREYSDTETEIKKMKARLSALKNTDNDDAYDRYTDKNPNAEMLVKRYDMVKNKIDKINAKLNELRATGGSAKETREDREDLRAIRSSYMKDLNDDFKEYTKD